MGRNTTRSWKGLITLLSLFILSVSIYGFVLFRLRGTILGAEQGFFHKELSEILNMVESRFLNASQLAASLAAVTEDLPGNEEAHERFLVKMLESSQASFVYGVGIWYEPWEFDPRRELFGPYVRFDRPGEPDISVTYQWSSGDYNYLEKEWYRHIFHGAAGEVSVTAPFFDHDYTYITFGTPFFSEGIKRGAVTVDIILPTFEQFFREFDIAENWSVFLITDQDDILYSSDTLPAISDEPGLTGSLPPECIYPEVPLQSAKIQKIAEAYSREGVEICLTIAEKPRFPWRLYAVVAMEEILQPYYKIRRILSLVFIIFWGGILTVRGIRLRYRTQTVLNRELVNENVELKEEIERRMAAERNLRESQQLERERSMELGISREMLSKANERLRFLAYHDAVTELSNLRAFLENQPLPSDGDSRYLLLVNLQNLRDLSIILDRHVIDSLLREFSQQLTAACGFEAEPYRGPGFSFYLVYHGGEEQGVKDFSSSLSRKFANVISLGNREVVFRLRIGICPFAGAMDLDGVLQRAEAALTGENSGGGISFFDSRHQEVKDRRIALETAMGRPQFLQEIYTCFQPIVDLSSGAVIGFETLARWHSPMLGEIYPDSFIPLAEETGRIIELGWEVLRRTLSFYRKASGLNPDIVLNVNVSPLQFIESDFPQRLESLYKEWDCPREAVKLEVTESAIAEQESLFWRTAGSLEALGFRLVVDDFGTGSSSLSRLYSFSFDTIKIDKSFIWGIIESPKSQEIIRAILTLAQGLDLRVVAEGIEDSAHLSFLKNLSCQMGQGYLFSRPVVEEEALKLVGHRYKIED